MGQLVSPRAQCLWYQHIERRHYVSQTPHDATIAFHSSALGSTLVSWTIPLYSNYLCTYHRRPKSGGVCPTWAGEEQCLCGDQMSTPGTPIPIDDYRVKPPCTLPPWDLLNQSCWPAIPLWTHDPSHSFTLLLKCIVSGFASQGS